MDNNNTIFVAFDGDSVGSRVGQAVLADNIPGIKEISAKIQAGQDALAAWARSYNADPISFGGDEASYQLPTEAMDTIEQARKDYEYATGGITCTAGVGSRLSEAGMSLIVGKLRGKNLTCTFDDSVAQEFAQAEQDTANGTATGEAAKLGHAYMQKGNDVKNDAPSPATDDSHDDCPYCQELSAQGDSDPDHCSSCHDEGDDCPYCNETDDEDAAHDPSAPDHEDDCPYCQEAAADESAGGDPEAEDAAVLEEDDGTPQVGEGANLIDANGDGIADDPAEHSKEGMEAILEQIVNEDGEGNPIEGETPEDMDDTAEPVTDGMDGNISRPEGYDASTPGDMGVDAQNSENLSAPQDDEHSPSPDFGSVLQDGLDDHADSIQKERVMSMVAEALQGFKANKGSLDQAKDQVPGLYTSSIAMLRAMIEMAKLLGLENSPETPQSGAPTPPPIAAQQAMPAAGVPPSPKLLG